MTATRQRIRLEIADAAARHYRVRHSIEDIEGSSLELFVPVWAPGSYTVRDFSGNFVSVEVSGPGSPTIEKLESSRWQVTGAQGKIELDYTIFAPELGVRSNDISDTHAFVHPPATFLGVEGRLHEGLELEIDCPKNWEVFTALEPRGKAWFAGDYDRLMDCPIEIGAHECREFTVDGKRHRFVFSGEGNVDIDRVMEDTRRIVEYEIGLFGGTAPYDEYLFILLLTGGAGGGLEHSDSTVLAWPRLEFRPEKEYRKFLTLVAHEFFHVWNIKRIRPETLLEYDYSTPQFTRLLWVFEGWTTYFDEVICSRAECYGPKHLLEALAEHAQTERSRPGGGIQSLEESSFDSWIKLYRPTPDTQNTQTNYYLKGLLVGWLLDLHIRERSGGERSLDDVMQHLWTKVFPSGRGLPEDGAAALIREATGIDVDDFLETHVRRPGALDYDAALQTIGLRMRRKEPGTDEETKAWLGATLKPGTGGTTLGIVFHGGPAHSAGLMAGDEVVALDGIRVGRNLGKRIEAIRPGESARWAAFRDQRLVEGTICFGEDPVGKLEIVPREDATDAQRSAFKAWSGQAFDQLG